MTERVKLSRILEALESHHDKPQAVDCLALDVVDMPAEQEKIAFAGRVKANRYLVLPTGPDFGEYALAQKYVNGVQDEQVRATLIEALKGKGTFRRFKEVVRQVGLEEAWLVVRRQRFLHAARHWCRDHKIPYIDDVAGAQGVAASESADA